MEPIKRKKKPKLEKPLHETLKIIRLDWRTKLSFWVTDLLDAVHEGKKRHERKRKTAETWWTRNGSRVWNLLEAIAKLITKFLK